MATTTHGNLAEDAAAYLARSSNPIESLGGGSPEIERQSECLVEWAREKKVILSEAYTADLEKHNCTTAEHEVFYRASDNRAVKRTFPGTFGITNEPKGEQRHATPLFYLRRLELMNRIFGSDLRLEGVMFGKSFILGAAGEKPCLVISQTWFRAAVPNDPHPSEPEIEQFMDSLGFTRLPDAYFGWFRKKGQHHCARCPT